MLLLVVLSSHCWAAKLGLTTPMCRLQMATQGRSASQQYLQALCAIKLWFPGHRPPPPATPQEQKNKNMAPSGSNIQQQCVCAQVP